MRKKSGKIIFHSGRGQVSLELSIALVCLFILVVSSVKICGWLATQLAVRQNLYDSSRVQYDDPGIVIDMAMFNETTSDYPVRPLDVFP